jgi:hypothetical protein
VREVPKRTTKLGSRIAQRFRRVGLTADLPEWRGRAVRAADFESDHSRYERAVRLDADEPGRGRGRMVGSPTRRIDLDHEPDGIRSPFRTSPAPAQPQATRTRARVPTTRDGRRWDGCGLAAWSIRSVKVQSASTWRRSPTTSLASLARVGAQARQRPDANGRIELRSAPTDG